MYRPEGFKNPYSAESGSDEAGRHFDWAAGANAYAEGLKKDSIHVRKVKGWDALSDIFKEGNILHYGESGYLVFIPEE